MNINIHTYMYIHVYENYFSHVYMLLHEYNFNYIHTYMYTHTCTQHTCTQHTCTQPTYTHIHVHNILVYERYFSHVYMSYNDALKIRSIIRDKKGEESGSRVLIGHIISIGLHVA